MTAAAIALVEFNQQLVLVRRRDIPIWVLPGGGIDPGELPEEAVIREVKEETGLDVVITQKLAEYSPINFLTQPVHLFRCQVIGGEFTTGDESRAVNEFPLEKLPKSLFHIHRGWIKETVFNRNLIKRPLKEISLWKSLCYGLCHPLQMVCFGWTACKKISKKASM